MSILCDMCRTHSVPSFCHNSTFSLTMKLCGQCVQDKNSYFPSISQQWKLRGGWPPSSWPASCSRQWWQTPASPASRTTWSVRWDGNLIDMIVGTTWEECSLLCEDEVACLTFNFFGPESNFHPHNACLLFSECESKVPSEDCLLGSKETSCTCTSVKHCPCNVGYNGAVDGDNYVDISI